MSEIETICDKQSSITLFAVNALKPHDISVVAAFGDSITVSYIFTIFHIASDYELSCLSAKCTSLKI